VILIRIYTWELYDIIFRANILNLGFLEKILLTWLNTKNSGSKIITSLISDLKVLPLCKKVQKLAEGHAGIIRMATMFGECINFLKVKIISLTGGQQK